MIKCDGKTVEIKGLGKDILTELGVIAKSVVIMLVEDGMPEQLAILRVSNVLNEAVSEDLGFVETHEKESDGVCRLS